MQHINMKQIYKKQTNIKTSCLTGWFQLVALLAFVFPTFASPLTAVLLNLTTSNSRLSEGSSLIIVQLGTTLK